MTSHGRGRSPLYGCQCRVDVSTVTSHRTRRRHLKPTKNAVTHRLTCAQF